jgi:ribosomal protein L11 methyltransferase
VVSNILTPVIIDLLPNVAEVLSPGGRFICSGILLSQQDEVVAKAQTLGFQVIEVSVREEWVAIAMILGTPGVSSGC